MLLGEMPCKGIWIPDSLLRYKCSTSDAEHLNGKELGICIGQYPEGHSPLKMSPVSHPE